MITAVTALRNQVPTKNLTPSTSEKLSPRVVFSVHIAPEEAFEQSHMISPKISTKQTQNWHPTEITFQFFFFVLYETDYSLLDSSCQFSAIASWQPAGKHICGKARQRGVKVIRASLFKRTQPTY